MLSIIAVYGVWINITISFSRKGGLQNCELCSGSIPEAIHINATMLGFTQSANFLNNEDIYLLEGI